jgi:predicted O-methyltransferase YrrM
MEMTPDRWDFTNAYSAEVFGAQDEHLAGLMDRAVAAGLPPISVSADVGRLLRILTSLTPGHLALEVGTLAGYSAIWIARGLADDGRLLTVELDPKHAAFARAEIDQTEMADKIEIVEGAALEVLPALLDRLGPESVDLAFVDAAKSEYVDYFRQLHPMIKRGGLLVVDNVYGTGAGWIDEGHGADALNRAVAGDPDFEAVAIPLRQGVMIARKR